jgi:molybdopterin synthase sulfur carrier subunit
MKIKVRVFGDLIPLLGDEVTVELSENARISDLILKINEKISGFKEKIKFLSTRQGVTDFNFIILLNGLNVDLLEGDKTRLKDGDVVVFMPPVAGGSP